MNNTDIVLDASALLAYVFKETGHEVVSKYLAHSCISSVNLLEIASRFSRDNISPQPVLEMIQDLGISIVPFTEKYVSSPAALANKVKPYGLSMADRVCLGLGADLNLPVLTGDKVWTELGVETEIILFRS